MDSSTAAPVIAREYLRVSLDKSGRARSVTEQHDDNDRAGQQHGFTLNGEAYSDVSVSASRYARTVRGDFARLLTDLEHGRFGADILVLWESSRGSRRVGEWATLVDLLEDAWVRVHVTTHGRTYDPANPRDRRTLMEDAVDSEYESGKASARIARAMAANAAEGKPHGKTPFGYRRRYEVSPSGRRMLAGQEPDDAEAPVVRELFARLRQGHSLRAIARDFEARGIRTRTGKVFIPEHLRDLALRPAYGGYRVHRPGNKDGGTYTGPLPAEPNADWPALVDSQTFWSVRRLLLSPGRRTSRPGRGIHLLSMIAKCGECGGAMSVLYRRGERMYRCRDKSCATILADDLDAYAEAAMLAYLARDDVIEELRAGGEDDGELARVRADLAAARAELDELRAAGRARKLTVATVMAIEPGLAAAVEDAERRERELSAPPVLAGLIEPGKDAAARWDAAPMPARRAVARLLCSPGMLGALAVRHNPEVGRGHRIPAQDRVTWDRQA
jgi:DNA invertase Pin-like site-specific DNA recombinase